MRFEKPHPLNLAILFRVLSTCIMLKIRYAFGEKINDLDAFPPHEKECDCSGGIRYLVYQATEGLCKMPDGSVNQRQWCEDNHLYKLKKYSDVVYGGPYRVFICFFRPRFGKAGHVWIVCGGWTIECRSGRIGFTRRPWNTLVLKLRCEAVYELPVLGVNPNI
jgi:hypothetical protein